MHPETLTDRLVALLHRPVGPDDRRRAVLHLLDWVGCAAIGAASEPGRLLRNWADAAGPGPCRVLFGKSASAGVAAFANGGFGNVLEMDDVHKTAILHPGPVVIPAALAAAQTTGRDAAALLDGIVRGYEAVIRLGRTVGPAHYARFHNTATCGPFGSAAAACDVLGLPTAQWRHALGNAASMAGGVWQMRHEPVMTKQLHTARAAEAGLTAAQLAAAGFTGPSAILEGPQGFYAGLCPDGDPDALLTEPEGRWLIHVVSFKPWPACRHAHAAIDAALVLRRKLEGRRPVRVAIETYSDAAAFCDRPRPTSTPDAKFSLQHAVAVALIDGPPTLSAFEPAALDRADLADLRARCEVTVSTRFDDAYPRHYGSGVRLTLSDGDALDARVDDALGDPESPLQPSAIRNKATTLMCAAGISKPAAEGIADRCLAIADAGPLDAFVASLP